MHFEHCQICPRNCGIDRRKDLGFCKAPNQIKIARAALHFFEEPPISGKNGSGTIFFSCCNLRCLFCQNHKLSKEQFGEEITVTRLVEIFFELAKQGAENINLVTPTPYIPLIKEAIIEAKKKGFSLPFVYNTGGYEKIESLKELEGLIDIYLPDFKYFDNRLASLYSSCPDYVEVSQKALAEMVRQTGPCKFNEKGMMIKGVLVRHLLLPTHEEDSKHVLNYLYHTYKNQIYISIMNQYTPLEHVKNHPVLGGTIKDDVYQEVIDYALNLGVENAFIQEGGTCSESFIPSFQLEGVHQINK